MCNSVIKAIEGNVVDFGLAKKWFEQDWYAKAAFVWTAGDSLDPIGQYTLIKMYTIFPDIPTWGFRLSVISSILEWADTLDFYRKTPNNLFGSSLAPKKVFSSSCIPVENQDNLLTVEYPYQYVEKGICLFLITATRSCNWHKVVDCKRSKVSYVLKQNKK